MVRSFHVSNHEIIRLNRSKSLLIRYLIADFLYNHHIGNVADQDAEDAKIVHRCLQLIDTHTGGSDCTTIDVKDCGTAYRFLLSVLAITPGNWFLTGTNRLINRPISPVIQALKSIDADIRETDEGLYIVGKELHATELTIDGRESSQFASSLLLIADKIGAQHIHFPPETSSFPYITMTRRVLEIVKSHPTYEVESDWSTAAFWYAFLLLSDLEELTLENLHLNSIQGDSIVAEWFSEMGIASMQSGNDLRITKKNRGELPSLCLSFLDHPDLAPVVAVAAVLSPFSLSMNGLQNLNHKESNRLNILYKELSPFAALSMATDSTLTICKKDIYVEDTAPLFFQTYSDHRWVMAFSLFALRYRIDLSDTACVVKSYPQFKKYFRGNPQF